MEPEYVSSPTRNAKFHPSFSIRYPDGETRFFTQAFRNYYAGNYWLRRVMETGCAELWMDDYTLILTHKSKATLTIREHHLQDVIEYEPTKEELTWAPSYPTSAILEQLTKFWDWQKKAPYNDTEQPEPKPKAPAPNRHKTTKATKEGQITVAQIAEEAKLPANKARQILRKAGLTKPTQGWTYNLDDPEVIKIRSLFG